MKSHLFTVTQNPKKKNTFTFTEKKVLFTFRKWRLGNVKFVMRAHAAPVETAD